MSVQMVVQSNVADFDAWKVVFDENRALREKHGATGHRIYRGVDDPTAVMVVTTFASAEGAAAFATDPALKEAMERSGITSAPSMAEYSEADATSY
jgi:heme-degrading monooxygenase HmoA